MARGPALAQMRYVKLFLLRDEKKIDISPFHKLEFDELMRSGTTMKVSLTPDRLKTFEVSLLLFFFPPWPLINLRSSGLQ